MSMPLSRLRNDLDRLTRRRAVVRFGTVAAMLGLALLAALAAAFIVDYFVDFRPVSRAMMLLAIAGITAWLVGRAVGPQIAVKETTTDVALDVERRQSGARDLVAALQFQSDEAATWGSPQLERAVVGSVDDASRDLNVFENFAWKPLPERLGLLGVIMLMAILLAVVFPLHASAFFRRLMLADVPYPTQTMIASTTLNGTPIDWNDTTPLRAAAGSPLRFTATVDGVRPTNGTVVLTTDSGNTTNVTLEAAAKATLPDDRTAPVARQQLPSPATANVYAGRLDAIRESVSFTVRLGDAETRARRIELMPRPTITLDLQPTPPAYAQTHAPAAPPSGVRTAFVLEGSAVAMTVHAVNKPLSAVTVTIDDSDSAGPGSPPPSKAAAGIPLTATSDGRTWTLDPDGTPFENVRQPLSFTITGVDRDGLAPAQPLTGSIRLRADRPPRVAASAVVQDVLPTARPTISYGASDDFGLKGLRASIAVTRADGGTDVTTISLPLAETRLREFQGRHTLDLSPLALVKGDRLVVTVEAEDTRGERPGESAIAEPITFQVTDRAGLLATLLESDEDSADRLDAIIRRELGIGEER